MVESAGCEGACSTLSHDGKVSPSNVGLSNPGDQGYDSSQDDESDAECLQILVELEEMLGLESILEPFTKTREGQDALNVESSDNDRADPISDFESDRDVSTKEMASSHPQPCTVPEISGSTTSEKCSNFSNRHEVGGKLFDLEENFTELCMKVLPQTTDVTLPPTSTSKTQIESAVLELKDLNENIFTSSFLPEVSGNMAAILPISPPELSSLYKAECALNLKSINSHDSNGSEPELEYSRSPPILEEDLRKVVRLKACFVDLCKDNILLTSQNPDSQLMLRNSPQIQEHIFLKNQDCAAVESESTQSGTSGIKPVVGTESTQSDKAGITYTVESELTESDAVGIPCAVESSKLTESDAIGIPCAIESELTESNAIGIPCAVESELTDSNAIGIPCAVESELTESNAIGIPCAVESELTESDAIGIPCAVESQATQCDASGMTSAVQILTSIASEGQVSWKVDSDENLVDQGKPLVELSEKAFPSTEVSTAGLSTENCPELSQKDFPIKEVSPAIPKGSCAFPSREKPSSDSEYVYILENAASGGPSTSSGFRQERIATVNIPTQVTQSKPRTSTPWISSDAAENADNDDPKWELMRKLRTDEERYRILRKRWKNLTIPDPKKDLTVQSFRKRRMYLKKKSEQLTVGDSNNNIIITEAEPPSRKRARSPDSSPCDEPPYKRRARWSCTHVLDQRVATMKHNMDMKFKELHTEYRAALFNLSVEQKREKENLLFHLRGRHPASVEAAIGDQYFRHVEEVDMLKHQYEERLQNYEEDRHKLINLLRSASQEINAFHKFYHQLNHSNDDQMWISDGEVDELAEAERMYELYDTLYQS